MNPARPTTNDGRDQLVAGADAAQGQQAGGSVSPS
jgi:hypothetical protein